MSLTIHQRCRATTCVRMWRAALKMTQWVCSGGRCHRLVPGETSRRIVGRTSISPLRLRIGCEGAYGRSTHVSSGAAGAASLCVIELETQLADRQWPTAGSITALNRHHSDPSTARGRRSDVSLQSLSTAVPVVGPDGMSLLSTFPLRRQDRTPVGLKASTVRLLARGVVLIGIRSTRCRLQRNTLQRCLGQSGYHGARTKVHPVRQ